MILASAAATGTSWLAALVDWVVSLMGIIGPAGVGIAIALENIFPPIPSEAVLPAAGLAAHEGQFDVWVAIAFATAGSVVGALALYWIGALVGIERLRWLFARIPLLKADDIDRTVAWFERRGGLAVFFGRFIPIFRSLISIPAGVVRMPLWRFLLYTAIGSLIWNTVFVLIGWYLGSAWHVILPYMDIAQNVVIVVVALAVAVFLFVRIRAVLRERRAR
ncbi:DedA family protein [Microbacterium indicum]|uniref:DedA family protein n=1 Tax=Microbacterium indicum TaxID=358100 RepID=UPI00041E4D1D|nr:DedA family protein [Microbacterium indicum]